MGEITVLHETYMLDLGELHRGREEEGKEIVVK